MMAVLYSIKSDLAEATVFVTGSNEWRRFDTWPPENVSEKTLYFQPSGALSFSVPGELTSYDEYVSDRSFATS